MSEATINNEQLIIDNWSLIPDMSSYLYLHGFASGTDSIKAKYLQSCFEQVQIPLGIPDLNQGDFANLTLSRQLRQVAAEFANLSSPITLIGSSLGGLTAAWLGEKYWQVTRLVLLLTNALPEIWQEIKKFCQI